MFVRFGGGGLLLVAMLTACGQGDTRSQSQTDIARQLGCTNRSAPQVHAKAGYTRETCHVGRDPLSIFTFQKVDARYNVVVEGSATHVRGDGWDVWCSNKPECVEVQHLIGGDLIQEDLSR